MPTQPSNSSDREKTKKEFLDKFHAFPTISFTIKNGAVKSVEIDEWNEKAINWWLDKMFPTPSPSGESKCKKHGVVHRNGGYASCPTPPQDWEKEFDEKFVQLHPKIDCTKPTPIWNCDSLKSFITPLLHSEREQIVRWLENRKHTTHLEDGRGWCDECMTPETCGFNCGIDSAIALIENK